MIHYGCKIEFILNVIHVKNLHVKYFESFYDVYEWKFNVAQFQKAID